MESFVVKKQWRCTFDPTFESGKRRKARGVSLFNEVDDISPLTNPVAFDTLLQDESLSEDVREILRTCLFLNGQKSRKSFGACKTLTHVFFRRISILTVDFNTSLVVYLTNVPTLENFALILFTLCLVGTSFSRLCLGATNVSRGWQFLTRTHVFLVTVCCSPGSRGNSRVLGVVAVWSTAVDISLMRGSEHLCIFVVFFLLCLVSVSVWNDTEKISVSLRRCRHPSIEKCSQVSCCTVSANLCLFSFLLASQGFHFALL